MKPVGWLKRDIADRSCKVCKSKYRPFSSLQTFCSPSCGLFLSKRIQAKERKDLNKTHRKETKLAKERLLTRSDHLKRCQVIVNRWVRLRDKDLPCISCGTTEAKWDAGHYRSVGAAPELRFEPTNIAKQCMRCNSWRSGSAIEYRLGLIKRIGIEKVEWLEGPHEPKKYTVDEIRAIESHYKAEIKKLQPKGG